MKDADLKNTLERMAAAAKWINRDANSQADESHRERIHAEIAKDIDRI
jgi:hypothetical protein